MNAKHLSRNEFSLPQTLFYSAILVLFALFSTSCTSTGAGDAGAAAWEPYYEHAHDGRIYVIGQIETEMKFKESPHLPYTDTRIGMGPKGETVVLEVDKKDPGLSKRLWEKFKARNLFYAEVPKHGRIYVVGSEKMRQSLEATGHMPYTRTFIGYGPGGETVVFEVDKKNPALANRLQREFDENHRFYEEVRRHGRLYVIGNKKTYDAFLEQGHLPYTHTIIGGGPNNETLVFEVDKKNPFVLSRIKDTFADRHSMKL